MDRAVDGGATPLFVAAQKGHDAVVARLLAAGAAVDRAMDEGPQDDETDAGATPLMKAAQGGHAGAVRLLLSETQGATPRNCAAAAGGATAALFADGV